MLNDLKFNSSLESSFKQSILVFVSLRRKHKENNTNELYANAFEKYKSVLSENDCSTAIVGGFLK